jgi:hypothetical protein
VRQSDLVRMLNRVHDPNATVMITPASQDDTPLSGAPMSIVDVVEEPHEDHSTTIWIKVEEI